jgi:hypothetical protein
VLLLLLLLQASCWVRAHSAGFTGLIGEHTDQHKGTEQKQPMAWKAVLAMAAHIRGTSADLQLLLQHSIAMDVSLSPLSLSTAC